MYHGTTQRPPSCALCIGASKVEAAGAQKWSMDRTQTQEWADWKAPTPATQGAGRFKVWRYTLAESVHISRRICQINDGRAAACMPTDSWKALQTSKVTRTRKAVVCVAQCCGVAQDMFIRRAERVL